MAARQRNGREIEKEGGRAMDQNVEALDRSELAWPGNAVVPVTPSVLLAITPPLQLHSTFS